LKKIVYSNCLLVPTPLIPTKETGTRHKAAERTAKQANTFVIAVSERRKKTTLYYNKTKYYLKSSDELLRDITNNMQLLEKQREILDEALSKLNILEMSELVSVGDVCKVIQRIEMILKISEIIKKDFVELGKEGNVMNMRYKELLKNLEKKEDELLRDYSKLPLQRIKTLLSNLSLDGLIDPEAVSRLVFEQNLEETVSPRGFRFLAYLNLNEKEISQIVKQFESLSNLLNDESNSLEEILKNRAQSFKEEISKLREQVLEGKVVF